MSLVKKALRLLNDVADGQEKENRRLHTYDDFDPITECYCNATNAPCSWCTRTECDDCGETVEDTEEAYDDENQSLICKECREAML